jgi:uncharacterized membrane protein YqhA
MCRVTSGYYCVLTSNCLSEGRGIVIFPVYLKAEVSLSSLYVCRVTAGYYCVLTSNCLSEDRGIVIFPVCVSCYCRLLLYSYIQLLIWRQMYRYLPCMCRVTAGYYCVLTSNCLSEDRGIVIFPVCVVLLQVIIVFLHPNVYLKIEVSLSSLYVSCYCRLLLYSYVQLFIWRYRYLPCMCRVTAGYYCILTSNCLSEDRDASSSYLQLAGCWVLETKFCLLPSPELYTWTS